MTSTLRYALIGIAAVGGILLLAMPLVPYRVPLQKNSMHAALFPVSDTASASDTSDKLPSPQLAAGAAMVYDPLGNKILFEKNSDSVFGIASITKIMTAIVALERVGEHELIPIRKEAVDVEGIEGGLYVGERFPLHNLVLLMLITSSNDAAAALAEYIGTLYGANSFEESQHVFTVLMNETARKLGLVNTHFENPTGLDIDEDARIISNVSTPRELSQLIAHALGYPLIQNIYSAPSVITSLDGISHELVSTHTLLENEAGIISGKTGFTDTAGGTLATVAEVPLGKLSIMVILDSTRQDRFQDTVRLLEWLRAQ
ncbi:MAG: D-alanyl-D-alanine carboxypeptidase (penicillin-binding protein 5/6) [Parcubacteria group bacterium Gr01-1014_70]|nr:MAG: D-alanyl-D-alanine carboxypeptidase (penicillin-binding protein 5/6) [Parcubacteria group bacterium Gr01-1014_70]